MSESNSSYEQLAPQRVGAEHEQLRRRLLALFGSVRRMTELLMGPLLPDDFRIQTMPEVSPPYWNLGHTSWFFARNILAAFDRLPETCDGMDYALNSYYEGIGPRLPRERRGQVASPSTEAVRSYRNAVDETMVDLLTKCSEEQLAKLAPLVTIGCQHEQQHQELFLTEIQHIRWSAPAALRRGYLEAVRSKTATTDPGPMRAQVIDATDTRIGFQGIGFQGRGFQGRGSAAQSFHWDNELPPHRVHVSDVAIADRLITNAEWQAFIEDGGYQQPLLWLSNGWQQVKDHDWHAPLYWQRDGSQNAEQWQRFSLYGLEDVDPHDPVCHISFYEADAFARWYGEQHREWRGARLPRECEWEHAARTNGFCTEAANLLDEDLTKSPLDVTGAGWAGSEHGQVKLRQLAGTAWEWTSSHYEPYPGYRPYCGALTEYNGKFMDNQRVLRGGSFATPRAQARVSYRNFWPPATRFQATSVRLLRDL